MYVCITVCSQFSSEFTNIRFCFRNEFPTALAFSQLSIGIASSTINTELTVLQQTNEKLNQLLLNPGEIKCIPFSFVPSASDIGNEIQVSTDYFVFKFDDEGEGSSIILDLFLFFQLKYISLMLGNKCKDDRTIILRFSGICTESDILERKESHTM